MLCFHLSHVDCGADLFRCNPTTIDCVPLADACDTIPDCRNGEDEDNCVNLTLCENGGTRIDGRGGPNECICGARYSGALCEVDGGQSVHVTFKWRHTICSELIVMQ